MALLSSYDTVTCEVKKLFRLLLKFITITNIIFNSKHFSQYQISNLNCLRDDFLQYLNLLIFDMRFIFTAVGSDILCKTAC